VRGESHGPDGPNASIEGLVNGELLDWTLTGPFVKFASGNPPSKTYRGEATVNTDQLSGSASGQWCPCTVFLRQHRRHQREEAVSTGQRRPAPRETAVKVPGMITIIRRRAAVSMLVSAVFTACATTTPSAPDTEKQKTVRSDLEQCAAGPKAHSLTVGPEGNYSFKVQGTPNADTVLACMASKGYSGVRVDDSLDHGPQAVIRSGGEGQSSGN
jgi:hypothetical protein